jgi:hypothetical protein
MMRKKRRRRKKGKTKRKRAQQQQHSDVSSIWKVSCSAAANIVPSTRSAMQRQSMIIYSYSM